MFLKYFIKKCVWLFFLGSLPLMCRSTLAAYQGPLLVSSPGVFLCHLCHFIKTALGKVNRKLLSNAVTLNAFICHPVVTKDMWVVCRRCIS
jgi:hypothetical protein